MIICKATDIMRKSTFVKEEMFDCDVSQERQTPVKLISLILEGGKSGGGKVIFR